jgi:3-oxoacyl-[acyl-carrier protein] reductase
MPTPTPAKPVALITGASSGIGAATALALAPRWRLALVARRADRLADLVARVAGAGGEAEAFAADLADVEAPRGVVDRTMARFGRLDALVNNAGAFAVATADAITAEHLERLWRLNVRAPMLLVGAALAHLPAGGCIANVSSVAAESAFTGCGAYAATKAALEAWSRVLREELRPRRIRVGVVAPGATDTEVWPADSSFDRGRMCRPEDVAAAIRFVVEQAVTASVDRLVVAPPGGAL